MADRRIGPAGRGRDGTASSQSAPRSSRSLKEIRHGVLGELFIRRGPIADLGGQGPILLLTDCTNVERPGYTPSERLVGEKLDDLADFDPVAFAEALLGQ